MTQDSFNRRLFLKLGLGAGIAGGVYLMRPEAQGSGGHSTYFEGLSTAMHEAGLYRPTMLLDLDRLDQNIDRLAASIPDTLDYRVVAKSLPSPKLLDYVTSRAKTNRLMVFHQPFLNQLAATQPDKDVLIGKPLPVKAAARFYDHHTTNAFDPASQLQWLIDTPARLQEYAALAAGRDLAINVNIEIDVGLHRGGVSDPSETAQMLDMIAAAPNLTFTGLMGYDAHVSKVPTMLGMQRREFAAVLDRYQSHLTVLRDKLDPDAYDALTLNAAGSPTFRRYKDIDFVTELAAGSALVKALDFDLPDLADLDPAIFIGTPVLKASGATQIPALPGVGAAWAKFDRNRARTFFIYGGYWKAHPVSPEGLRNNGLYGRSTNQEILNGSDKIDLTPNDFVFLRPTQSEFVMLQFGDLAIVRNGKIVDYWPVLEQGA